MPVLDNYDWVAPGDVREARERLMIAKDKKADVELQLGTKDKDGSPRYRAWRARALYSRRVSEKEIANLRRWLSEHADIHDRAPLPR